MRLERVRITLAQPEDVEFIKRLETACGLSIWSREDYLKEIAEGNPLFLVAKSGNKSLGYILARLITYEEKHSFESEAEIYNLAVEPQSRRNGVAAQLLNKIIKTAAAQNLRKIHLEVRKSNAGAISFYQKMLFGTIGERKNFYTDPTEDAVLMSRSITTEDFV